jgi:hypothetical protein
MRATATLGALAALMVIATPLRAQGTVLRAQPSGRATTSITLSAGQVSTPQRVVIDFGQPHARGRTVLGGLIPFDAVWRTGANEATTLRTDVDLSIGGMQVPKGAYTLWTRATRNGAQLIVNKQTGQWGTAYDEKQDLVRVDLKQRTLTQPLESFTMWLLPASGATPGGELRMAWGTAEFSVPFTVR